MVPIDFDVITLPSSVMLFGEVMLLLFLSLRWLVVVGGAHSKGLPGFGFFFRSSLPLIFFSHGAAKVTGVCSEEEWCDWNSVSSTAECGFLV